MLAPFHISTTTSSSYSALGEVVLQAINLLRDQVSFVYGFCIHCNLGLLIQDLAKITGQTFRQFALLNCTIELCQVSRPIKRSHVHLVLDTAMQLTTPFQWWPCLKKQHCGIQVILDILDGPSWLCHCKETLKETQKTTPLAGNSSEFQHKVYCRMFQQALENIFFIDFNKYIQMILIQNSKLKISSSDFEFRILNSKSIVAILNSEF